MPNSTILRLLGVAIAIAGCAAGAFGAAHWRDASVIQMLRARGTEATARIESGRRTDWKGAAAYVVKLTWTGKGGEKREAVGVPITAAYAKEVVRGGQFLALTVPIRYDAKQPKLSPVIVPDAERLEAALTSRGDFWFWLGVAGLAAGVLMLFGARRLKRSA